MDEADVSDLRMQRELDALLRVRRPVPEPTGACRWCGEPAESARLFCSPECREDSEQAARFRR